MIWVFPNRAMIAHALRTDYTLRQHYNCTPRRTLIFKKSRPAPRGSFGDRPTQMFQATCTECGERCEVPFKPSGGKPVLCKACFSQNGPSKTRDRDSRPSYGSDRSDSRGSDSRGSSSSSSSSSSSGPDLSKIQRQLSTIEAKLDQLLEMFEDMDEEEDEDDKD